MVNLYSKLIKYLEVLDETKLLRFRNMFWIKLHQNLGEIF